MRLPVPMTTAVTAFAVVAGGCASMVEGEPVADPSYAVRPISGGDLNTVLLTPAQVSESVGTTLRLQVDAGRPIDDGGADGPCAALDNVGMRAFVGDSALAFHLLMLADGTGLDRDHVVGESVAVYPDSGAAAGVFAKAVAELPECDGDEVTREAAWRYAVNDVTADTLRWNKEQTDLPFLWVCYGQSRVRNNVIMQAMVCRDDDDGQANAEAIVNRMSATVWELAGD
jgi:hypothetical protein